jgi:ABC-type glucose/galactose transport system permease subunit
MKQSYVRPSLTEWGTVSDLTQGMGQTYSTDDHTCVVGMMEFTGSTGKCPPGQG